MIHTFYSEEGELVKRIRELQFFKNIRQKRIIVKTSEITQDPYSKEKQGPIIIKIRRVKRYYTKLFNVLANLRKQIDVKKRESFKHH